MAVKSLKKYVTDVEKLTKEDYNKALSTSNKNFETQKTEATNIYNKQIDDTSDSYEDLYRENAVQKHINELEVAENMANLGLTDSGLNRTQQTAIQLSYANNKNKFDVSRQKAVDSLTSELASKISEININKSNAAQSIKDSWNASNLEIATQMRNDDIEAETARYEAQQEQIAASNKAYYSAISKQQKEEEQNNSILVDKSNKKLKYGYKGTLKDNDITVTYGSATTTYKDTKTGTKISIPREQNPYTGTVNPYTENGTFDNGYQPDNIAGVPLKAVGTFYLGDELNRTQKVFFAKGKYWTWASDVNDYVQLKNVGRNKWLPTDTYSLELR